MSGLLLNRPNYPHKSRRARTRRIVEVCFLSPLYRGLHKNLTVAIISFILHWYWHLTLSIDLNPKISSSWQFIPHYLYKAIVNRGWWDPSYSIWHWWTGENLNLTLTVENNSILTEENSAYTVTYLLFKNSITVENDLIMYLIFCL